jgi:hypothetical protein
MWPLQQQQSMNGNILCWCETDGAMMSVNPAGLQAHVANAAAAINEGAQSESAVSAGSAMML